MSGESISGDAETSTRDARASNMRVHTPGRGPGVGRGLGVRRGLGVGVGRAVAVGAAVLVGLEVGVGLAVGEGVGLPADIIKAYTLLSAAK
jgi:hypothetical protein